MGLAVLALHIAVVGWIEVSSRMAAKRLDDTASSRATLRLLRIAVPRSPEIRTPALQRRLAHPAVPPLSGSPVPSLASERARSLSSTGSSAAITPPAPPASAASGADPVPPLLLETDASRRAIRESALAPRNDLQQNPRVTLEKKMNDAVGGDGRLVEEDLGNGRRRYRQNGQCIETTATRASQLFPEDTLPRPRLVGACP